MQYVMKEVWILSEDFLIDKQTFKMQGKIIYKTRCGKYKRIGDGIQTDVIANYGYTWDFYFCNEPVDMKWINIGMTPMHAPILHMFSGLQDTGHTCNMDNLFNSVNLVCEAFALPAKVKTDGVIQRSQRGVPLMVMQEELKGKRANDLQGTLKVVVL